MVGWERGTYSLILVEDRLGFIGYCMFVWYQIIPNLTYARGNFTHLDPPPLHPPTKDPPA